MYGKIYIILISSKNNKLGFDFYKFYCYNKYIGALF